MKLLAPDGKLRSTDVAEALNGVVDFSGVNSDVVVKSKGFLGMGKKVLLEINYEDVGGIPITY